MIKTNNINKTYGNLHVLKDINLAVTPCEIVTLVGASGAGKTTLLQIIGTLDSPDSGQVWINDKLTTEMNDKALCEFRNKEIGFVYQFHHLFSEFTALENVMMPALIGGQSRKDAEEKAKELLDVMHLYERADHKPNQLSGGEQQRVAIARALVNSPSVILADEPSGNLDSKNAMELHEYFFKLRETYKQTFLIVTHNEELARMSDRKIEMQDGKII
ncbi:MAG: ABC transporter ATP-binding protein [Candidatus Onthomorpha sp.]|nr:ABC transporter ATP-binding protein [Bacteroidales bacterium]MDY3977174.1 ABC transporter ATP-binding protein [Candidatus Onthomorpha sp.]MCI5715233.1 ABC transporter ATP-binding protein [Bacteroidales bacterium]MCI6644376.1 ABC transporter ATP-binding protein [Bacteroidales bacterium]MCI6801722.1 ABC transporter ATP-binding protein [Bacteroidales bacterium]